MECGSEEEIWKAGESTPSSAADRKEDDPLSGYTLQPEGTHARMHKGGHCNTVGEGTDCRKLNACRYVSG